MVTASHGIIILGMHRSGTSAIARGIQSLGADLGDNLLAPRFDNPTGYWEDKAIVELNDKILTLLGLTWEDANLIDEALWSTAAMRLYATELRHYVVSHFCQKPIWAFKDPRTLRLLPIWQTIIGKIEATKTYLLVVRNPLSVAASLYHRQAMAPEKAHRLWLAYHYPQLALLAHEQLCVVDFDLFMEEPELQLDRIARCLGIAEANAAPFAQESYLDSFLQPEMRHEHYSLSDLARASGLPSLNRDLYLGLRRLALVETAAHSPAFLAEWASYADAAHVALA